LDNGEKRRSPFGVSGGHPTPALEVEDGIFHQMAQRIEVFIVGTLEFPMFAWGNHGQHALGLRLRDDGIGVITAIRDQMGGG